MMDRIWHRWKVGQLVAVKAGHPFEHQVGVLQRMRDASDYPGSPDALQVAFKSDSRFVSLWLAKEHCARVGAAAEDAG